MAQAGDGPVINPDSDEDDDQVPDQVPNQVPNQVPDPPSLNPVLPNDLVVPAPPRPQLNWSHFKPKYAGKPDEDAKAHLLRTNDWMDTHKFLDHVKVQRFCLTLIGEARLWYELLRPINADWASLQNLFRQQYSKIGNTREQLFDVWSFISF